MNQQQLTPRERLKAERLRLQQACLLQEQRLNEDFAYVQENAGSLLMSGLSMLLFWGIQKIQTWIIRKLFKKKR